MAEIIRNTSHGNNISVVNLYNSKIIRKIAFDSYSRFYLLNERDGLTWYGKLFKNKPIFIKDFYKGENITKIDLNFIKGTTVNYIAPLRKTKFYIMNSIDHYLQRWPNSKYAPIHGDLTLSNIIFTNKKPIFIDWEHFSRDDFWWGFDIAYLLLSSIILPDRNKCNFNSEDIKIFSSLWKKIISKGLNKELSTRPLSYFRKIFTENQKWERIVKKSPNKLFPLAKSLNYCSYFEDEVMPYIIN
jgi:hypothetical protein